MKILNALSAKLEPLKKAYSQINFKELPKHIGDSLKLHFHDVISKTKNLAQTNFDLGVYHYLNGNKSDAILRFKLAKFFNPSYVTSDFYIGRCYQENFKYQKAKFFLEEYMKSSNQKYVDEAKYCLNIINNQVDKINHIPKNIIKATFDGIARTHDKIVIQQQDIAPQQALFSMMLQLLMERNKPFANNILDLGCGTGVIGKFCRAQKVANIIVGVEISPFMVENSLALIQDGMKVYNNVEQNDYELYLNHMQGAELKFDIVTASDFITYNSNLDFFFQNTYSVITENGLLGVTFKTTNVKEVEFKLQVEQFYFSLDYVKSNANKYNWKVLKEENVVFSNKEPGKIIFFGK